MNELDITLSMLLERLQRDYAIDEDELDEMREIYWSVHPRFGAIMRSQIIYRQLGNQILRRMK